VTPDFLDAVLDQVQDAGLDVISLDDAVQRIKDGDDRRFACFTFDDGYRDNLEYAYPLFKRRSLPLTLYVPTDYPDGNGELWWLALEEIVARASELELCRDNTLWRLPASTVPEKIRAFEEIYWISAISTRRPSGAWCACSPSGTTSTWRPTARASS
jgi:peptidoglycan/xylan/chitin deacetylase (PgdA/CDA1 family)